MLLCLTGGIRMSEEACNHHMVINQVRNYMKFLQNNHKTHNDAVFSAYTPEMRAARRNKDHHRTSRYIWAWTYRLVIIAVLHYYGIDY